MSGYQHIDPNDIEACSRYWSTLGSAETERLLAPLAQNDPHVIHSNYTRRSKIAKANFYLDYSAQLLQLNAYAFPETARWKFTAECSRLLAVSAASEDCISTLSSAETFKDEARMLYRLLTSEVCAAMVKTAPIGIGLPPQYSP